MYPESTNIPGSSPNVVLSGAKLCLLSGIEKPLLFGGLLNYGNRNTDSAPFKMSGSLRSVTTGYTNVPNVNSVLL